MKLLLILSLLFILISCTITDSNVINNNIQSKDTSSAHNSQGEMAKSNQIASTHKYMNYTPELLTESIKSGKTVALFFHAGWCPSCRSLDKTIISNLDSIPENILILKVNYDTSTDLKKQYGIVTQHTTIVLNSDLTIKYKKIGAQNVSDILVR